MARRKYKGQLMAPFRGRSNKVCCRCRVSAKGNGECPHCHAPMEDIGHVWRVPRQRDDKGWAMVERLVAAKRRWGLSAGDSPTTSSNDFGCMRRLLHQHPEVVVHRGVPGLLRRIVTRMPGT